jgi:hypothetical protein
MTKHLIKKKYLETNNQLIRYLKDFSTNSRNLILEFNMIEDLTKEILLNISGKQFLNFKEEEKNILFLKLKNKTNKQSIQISSTDLFKNCN